MARRAALARVMKWRGDWYLFFIDHSSGKRKRTLCSSLGAKTAKQRRRLADDFREFELVSKSESLRRGGVVAYDRSLKSELADYVAWLNERVQAREANPIGRDGLSVNTVATYVRVIRDFRNWLSAAGLSAVTTGELDARMVSRFLAREAAKPYAKGRRFAARSASTLNVVRRSLKTCFRYIEGLRPARFPDFPVLIRALKAIPALAPDPAAFSPTQLNEFLAKAMEMSVRERLVSVIRVKGGKGESFSQGVSWVAATPVYQLFLVVTLTGCRLGEALNLRWRDVDLDKGRIVILADKTGRRRWLPLFGAREGVVSPGLLSLLKQWRAMRPSAEFVLPHNGLAHPVLPKRGWEAVRKSVGLPRMTPQGLRQNFTSYAASVGIPPAITAMWQGHSLAVAERYYRSQVPDREAGKSIEEAMGMSEPLKRLIGQASGDTQHQPLSQPSDEEDVACYGS